MTKYLLCRCVAYLQGRARAAYRQPRLLDESRVPPAVAIEIVGSADKVLVYDRPLGSDGLRWRDLQAWWKESRGFDSDAEAKSTLYNRLKDSLPANSPPQRNLYHLHHVVFGAHVPDLPALLPEVWLHWDPQTARTQGKDALLRFRTDFLLLLPRGQRVVLEVDGETPLRHR